MLSFASKHAVKASSRPLQSTKSLAPAKVASKPTVATTKARSLATVFGANKFSLATSVPALPAKKNVRFYTIPPIRADLSVEAPNIEFHKDGRRIYSRSEVATHNTETDGWIIIDNKVYNVTTWIEFHPGGQDVLLNRLGGEATQDFYNIGHSHRAFSVLESLHIGYIREKRRYSAVQSTL